MQFYDPNIRGGGLVAKHLDKEYISQHLTTYQHNITEEAIQLAPNQLGKCIIMPTGSGKSYVTFALASMFQLSGILPIIITKRSMFEEYNAMSARFRINELYMVAYHSSNFIQNLKKYSTYSENRVYLIDEAHNFNTLDEHVRQTIIKTIGRNYVYLFTATLITSSFDNLYILTMLHIGGAKQTVADTLNRTFSDKRQDEILTSMNDSQPFKRLMRDNIVILKESPGAPTLMSVDIMEAPMTEEESKLYDNFAKKNGTAFSAKTYVKAEEANMFIASKIDIINTLASDSAHCVIVYTKFIIQVKKHLKHLIHSHVLLSKDMSQRKHAGLIHDINSPHNKNGARTKVIFIGPGTSEGISFVHADTVIFMSPPASKMEYVQVCGRAIRMNSLQYVDEDDRSVTPYILVASHFRDDFQTVEQIQFNNYKQKTNAVEIAEIAYEYGNSVQ